MVGLETEEAVVHYAESLGKVHHYYVRSEAIV